MCYRARGCALGVNVMFTARLMRYDHDSSASGHRLYTRQKLPQPSVALLGGSDTLGEAVHILGTSTFTRVKRVRLRALPSTHGKAMFGCVVSQAGGLYQEGSYYESACELQMIQYLRDADKEHGGHGLLSLTSWIPVGPKQGLL